MNVNSWLKQAETTISHLDAELILAHVLQEDRTFLHAHPDQELPAEDQTEANHLLKRRQNHEPLAYLTGHKEFYGRDFEVTKDTLIPRPETEALIDLAKHLNPQTILDAGTGSGCIAITLAKELPDAQITATDISKNALKVARQNAAKHRVKITITEANLLDGAGQYDLIIANLPYVDRNWDWLSPELKFEPETALYAEDAGLALIKRLIEQAPAHLNQNGHLLLEADLSQHQKIADFAEQTGNFTPVKTTDQSLALCLALRSR